MKKATQMIELPLLFSAKILAIRFQIPDVNFFLYLFCFTMQIVSHLLVLQY